MAKTITKFMKKWFKTFIDFYITLNRKQKALLLLSVILWFCNVGIISVILWFIFIIYYAENDVKMV
jgi:hypothetical protein